MDLQDGGVGGGGQGERDRWMEESERFTDGWQQDASVVIHVKATCTWARPY